MAVYLPTSGKGLFCYYYFKWKIDGDFFRSSGGMTGVCVVV